MEEEKKLFLEYWTKSGKKGGKEEAKTFFSSSLPPSLLYRSIGLFFFFSLRKGKSFPEKPDGIFGNTFLLFTSGDGLTVSDRRIGLKITQDIEKKIFSTSFFFRPSCINVILDGPREKKIEKSL